MKYTLDNLDQATDYYIDELVKNEGLVDPRLFELAQSIYNQRDLSSSTKQHQIANFPNLKQEVIQNLEKGHSVPKQVQYLVENGVETTHAKSIIERLNPQVQERKRANSGGFWILLAVLLWFLRLLYSKL